MKLIQKKYYTKAQRKKHYIVVTLMSIVILFLIIVSFWLLPKLRKTDSGLQVKVEYPKAYASDSKGQTTVADNNPVTDDFSRDLNYFSYLTASKILEDHEQVNYSPISLYYALAMTSTGAKGKTAQEFQQLLGQQSIKDLSISCGNLYRQLYRDNKSCNLKLANSLWMNQSHKQETIVFEHEFLANAARNFYASSHIVDFAYPSAGKAMSEWISQETQNTLAPKFKVEEDQLMALINTVYFKGQWENQFNKQSSQKDTFTSENGKQNSYTFMNTAESGSFKVSDNYICASLPMKDHCSMVFVLPNEGGKLQELTSSPKTLQKIFESPMEDSGLITWKMPQMDFSSSLDLNGMLKSLGLISAFEDSANFSGMSTTPLLITSVKQDTMISVDESGVTASAYTKVDMAKSSMPEKTFAMILDRPFLYAIKASNGSLLFIGRYDGQ